MVLNLLELQEPAELVLEEDTLQDQVQQPTQVVVAVALVKIMMELEEDQE
jgi:hypothetical protein